MKMMAVSKRMCLWLFTDSVNFRSPDIANFGIAHNGQTCIRLRQETKAEVCGAVNSNRKIIIHNIITY